MPLDILPAPAALPGATAPGGGPPGPAAAPGALAVFGLLLAQIVQPPGTPAPPGSPAAPGAVKSALLTDTTAAPAPAGPKSPGPGGAVTPLTDKTKDDGKDKPTAGDVPWAPPVAVIPLPAPVTMPPALTGSDKTTPGKVMDTVPLAGGELLSQPQQTAKLTPAQTPVSTPAPTQAPVSVQMPVMAQTPVPAQTPPSRAAAPASQELSAPAQTDVIVPAEAAAPVPAVVASLVPTVAAQASQAVVFPAAPARAGVPAKTATPAKAAALVKPAMPPTASPLPGAAPHGADVTPPVVTAPAVPQNGGPPADNQAGKIAEATVVAAPSGGVPAPTPMAASPGPQAAAGATPARSPVKASDATSSGSAPAPGAAQSPAPATVLPAAAPVPTMAPALGAAPMPGPDRTRMVRQVADGVQTVVAQAGGSGQRQVTLQLHPKDWGRLQVSVTMTPTTQADGKVSTLVVAHVVAETPAVKAALEAHQADLRHALQGAGLGLDTLTVTVQAPSGGAQAGLGGDRQPGTANDWNGTQAQTPGAGGQGGASFGGSGAQQSPFAGFAQGESSSRRPPSPYDTLPTPLGAGTDDLAVAAAFRPGLSGRVDTHA